MCSARAVVLMALTGTVWGCGSLKDHCNGSIAGEGMMIAAGTRCPLEVMHPQLFQGHISTKSKEIELFVYSRYSNDGHNKTVVPRTKITDSSSWNHPSAPCVPLSKCYVGDAGYDELHIEITCKTEGGCEVDYSLAFGCGNNGKEVPCTWTDWSSCAQSITPGNCTQNRYSRGPYNGGQECEGASHRKCPCPTNSPTHHPF
eukprot:Hpha_TRINITY_DN16495_c0_g8::TRINITY_DN16495_c0_g8_i1::g.159806::m.159806